MARKNHSSFRSTKKVTWEKVAPRIYIAIVLARFNDATGSERCKEIAFRLDGREANGYRVDYKGASILPWEAIDAGEPARTVRDGKAMVRAWLRGEEF